MFVKEAGCQVVVSRLERCFCRGSGFAEQAQLHMDVQSIIKDGWAKVRKRSHQMGLGEKPTVRPTRDISSGVS
jgi:hypothetical protein